MIWYSIDDAFYYNKWRKMSYRGTAFHLTNQPDQRFSAALDGVFALCVIGIELNNVGYYLWPF